MLRIFYRSDRVGKNGRVFSLLKFRTLKEGTDKVSKFAQEDQYTRFGWILRKTKCDELPQLWNLIKGDLRLVGPRPENPETFQVIPKHIRDITLSIKPGLTSPASLHFFHEEKILQQSSNADKDYHTKIKPMKLLLDVWYVQNRSFLLDLALIYMTIKKIIQSL